MGAVFHFLETYEAWIYLFLGLIALAYLNKLVISWQEWRAAVFGLERDVAQRRLSAALTVLILLLMLGILEFTLVSFVSPVVPRAFTLATPTVDVLAAPESIPESQEAAQVITPGMTPETESMAQGCLPDQIEWTFPRDGAEIRGVVELQGTVFVTNLGFYKYEFTRQGSENWVTIAAGNERKRDEALGGVWNTANLEPGDYNLRMVVSDNQNQVLPICQITVTVKKP